MQCSTQSFQKMDAILRVMNLTEDFNIVQASAFREHLDKTELFRGVTMKMLDLLRFNVEQLEELEDIIWLCIPSHPQFNHQVGEMLE